MKTFIICLAVSACLCVSGLYAAAQQASQMPIQPERLTIWEAYRLARDHYPSSRQRDLIALEVTRRAYLDMLSLLTGATLDAILNYKKRGA